MQLNKINNSAFKGLYISPNHLPEIYETADKFIPISHNYRLYLDKEKRIKQSKNADVFVLKDGTIYAENKDERIYIPEGKALFYRYYLALVHAQILEENSQKKTV